MSPPVLKSDIKCELRIESLRTLDSSYVREEKFFARVTAALMQPRQVNLLVLKKFAAYVRILTP